MEHGHRSRADALIALLAQPLDPDDRPAVARLAARLADRAAITRLLDRQLARLAADPLAQPQFDGSDDGATRGVILYRDAVKSVMLQAFRRDRESGQRFSLHFAPGRALLAFHNVEPVEIALYRADVPPCAYHGFAPDLVPPCRMVARRHVAAGDTLMLDREIEAMRIVTRDVPVAFARIFWPRISPLPARRYGMPDGRFDGAAMASEGDGRAQLMLSALRRMAGRAPRRSLAKVMLSHCRSPDFTLRWHALRCWLALDGEAAMPMLRQAARRDPHPQIRAAARDAIAALGGPTR
ncbi:MAG: hypothetical protein GW859_01065 [Sphingomonadales bacterium]|nr:hypothetical protein [Sphingomonadales bacterium]